MWQIGDRVLAQRTLEEYLYPGVIRHINEQRFFIIFDDGEDGFVFEKQMFKQNFEMGDQVFARLEGSEYLPGRITEMNEDQLRIRCANGVLAWVPLANLRVRIDTWKSPPLAEETGEVGKDWALGDRVLACWQDLFWYPGIILRV